MQDDRKARILASVDLPTLLLSHGIELRKEGQGYRAKCINHDDSNPSMLVYTKQGDHHCHCYACGYHANVIDVYMTLTGKDFVPAMQDLDTGSYEGKRFATIKDAPPIVKPERKVFPPPPEAGEPPWTRANRRQGDEWVSMGEPTDVWRYTTNDGATWYYEARYEWTDEDGEVHKEPRCFSWGQRGQQPARWELGFPPSPRPLYGLQDLATATQALVFEGPKKAAHARKLLNGNQVVACIAWPGGANAISKADWSPLEGLDVVLIPDSDEVGYRAIDRIAEQIKPASLKYVDTRDMDHAWDIADEPEWTKQDLLQFLRERKTEYTGKLIHDPVPPEPEPPQHTEPVPIEAYETAYEIDWKPPVDIFDEITAPVLDPAILPDTLRDFVADTAEVKGVDAGMVGLSCLVAVSAVLHDDIVIQPERTNPSWKERPHLWCAIVGLSGIRKSGAISTATSTIRKIDMDLAAKNAQADEDYKELEKLYKSEHSDYMKAVRKGDDKAVRPLKPPYPTIDRLWFEDVTVEKLAESLKSSRRGTLVVHDELSGFFAFNQYKGGTGTDEAMYLRFYDGGPLRVDRMTRESVITNFGGSIIGGIQPSTFAKIMQGKPESGMLQRFMIVNARLATEGSGKPYNKAASDRYHNLLHHVFETIPHPDPVYLSSEANKVRIDLTRYAFKLIEAKLIGTGFGSHLSKWDGLFSRLCLIWHTIQCAEKGIHPQSCEVSGETAEQVKAFMLGYLMPHAVSFYINLQAESTIGHAVRKIAELLLTCDTGDIGTSDISQGWIGWRHYKPYEQENALSILIDSGWIVPHPKARRSSKGYPTRYLINPLAKVTMAQRRDEEKARRELCADLIEKQRAEFRADILVSG